jgi:DNA-binding winged helix-turn-helix (wHTH) protein
MTTQYRFDDFKLLPAERLLFRRGAEMALTARAFELLVAFVERAGQLLAKDELLRRVWAGVVVEENNLAVQVGVLRKVLGAEAIATVPGFGYRFALEVIDVGAAATTETAKQGRGNLPLRLPPLIGREAELAEAAALLQAHPLLTVCGGPGFGKTRLAQELAVGQGAAYSDGAWWVDLTLLRLGESPAQAVARTLGLVLGVEDDPLAVLTTRLKSTAILIVLDNAEHVADPVAILAAALMQDTAQVRLIVTSQVPLRVAGEHLFRLPPLPAEDALRLLAVRAGTDAWMGDDRKQATAICESLDFNALAIELAAARIDALGLQGLAARLHQRLTLLAPGATAQWSSWHQCCWHRVHWPRVACACQ